MNAKSESALTSRTPRTLFRSRRHTDLMRLAAKCRYKSDLPMPDTEQASGMRSHCGRNGSCLPIVFSTGSVVNVVVITHRAGGDFWLFNGTATERFGAPFTAFGNPVPAPLERLGHFGASCQIFALPKLHRFRQRNRRAFYASVSPSKCSYNRS
jgi:hypothetical protein